MGYEQMSMLIDNTNIKQLNNVNYTYKSSALIESSYELTITEQRIIALGCKKLQPIYIENRLVPNDLQKVLGAMKFSLIEISVSEYREEYGIVGNKVYDSIQTATDDLYKKEIIYFDESGKLCKRRWMSSVNFDRKNGNIQITFNIDIILDLLVFNGKFVALFFDMSQDIKSKYSFRMYEILKNSAYLGKLKISVEEFKFKLKITDKYTDFADLNKKIIKPNLEVINLYSDISLEYKTIRSGRTVKWLCFNITKKRNATFSGDSKFKEKIPSAFNEISTALEKYNCELTSTDAQTLFDTAIEVTKEKYPDKNPVNYILEKVNYLNNYISKKPIENIIGFLKHAMEEDYGLKSIQIQPNQTKFNNFDAREYDYDKLEAGLLRYEEVSIGDVTK